MMTCKCIRNWAQKIMPSTCCVYKSPIKTKVLRLMAEILHQLIGSLSHYLPGFIHPRWCRISAINSITLLVLSRSLQSRL